MINIDIKDRKILYELDKNSRQSITQIGNKVGLSKQVVLYRSAQSAEVRFLPDSDLLRIFEIQNRILVYLHHQQISS